jgi:hypothetical protein
MTIPTLFGGEPTRTDPKDRAGREASVISPDSRGRKLRGPNPRSPPRPSGSIALPTPACFCPASTPSMSGIPRSVMSKRATTRVLLEPRDAAHHSRLTDATGSIGWESLPHVSIDERIPRRKGWSWQTSMSERNGSGWAGSNRRSAPTRAIATTTESTMMTPASRRPAVYRLSGRRPATPRTTAHNPPGPARRSSRTGSARRRGSRRRHLARSPHRRIRPESQFACPSSLYLDMFCVTT